MAVKLGGKRLVLVVVFLGAWTLFLSLYLFGYDQLGLLALVLNLGPSNHANDPQDSPPMDKVDPSELVSTPGLTVTPELVGASEPENNTPPPVELTTVYPTVVTLPVHDRIIIFPAVFSKPVPLEKYYQDNFDPKFSVDDYTHMVHANAGQSALNEHTSDPGKYRPHAFDMFRSNVDIGLDIPQCSAQLAYKVGFQVSEMQRLELPLTDVLKKLIDQKSPYWEEVSRNYRQEIDQQVAEGTVDKYWYRLAGSSVWLDQFGVHFVISRVLYAPTGAKDKPVISLTYAQIFNERWQELHNVELILPLNNPDVGKELQAEQVFSRFQYPGLLPIPFFHDNKRTDRRFCGPEDPRIMLVKNPKGYEEPLIVFNAYQRKIVSTNEEELDDHELTLRFDFYRSMFVSWPFQFQRGKSNIDDAYQTDASPIIYNRAVEMRRHLQDRSYKQKNWTPFILYRERDPHDEHIYFVYRWSKLEVMRCELASIEGAWSKCDYAYRMDHKLGTNDNVGALRGGTQLLNVNQLLSQHEALVHNSAHLLEAFPPDREIWLGFARAHLDNCGCGAGMYRPNMVVITRDGDGDFKISDISSFASLDVPILPWDPKYPDALCVDGGPSVLIPNGILAWSLEEAEADPGFEDYMTLAYSVTDQTVDIVHIKGLLSELYRQDRLVGNPRRRLFSAGKGGAIDKVGYNDDNVECALDLSRHFCSAFGLEHPLPQKPEDE